MPSFEKETINKLEHSKIEIMRNWAAVNGKAVRQRSNQQQTIMAAAGTLPITTNEIEKTGDINQVKVGFFSSRLYKHSSCLLLFLKVLN